MERTPKATSWARITTLRRRCSSDVSGFCVTNNDLGASVSFAVPQTPGGAFGRRVAFVVTSWPVDPPAPHVVVGCDPGARVRSAVACCQGWNGNRGHVGR